MDKLFLTPGQIEVLTEKAAGGTFEEVAKRLDLGSSAVEGRRHRALQGNAWARDTAHLMAVAVHQRVIVL